MTEADNTSAGTKGDPAQTPPTEAQVAADNDPKENPYTSGNQRSDTPPATRSDPADLNPMDVLHHLTGIAVREGKISPHHRIARWHRHREEKQREASSPPPAQPGSDPQGAPISVS